MCVRGGGGGLWWLVLRDTLKPWRCERPGTREKVFTPGVVHISGVSSLSKSYKQDQEIVFTFIGVHISELVTLRGFTVLEHLREQWILSGFTPLPLMFSFARTDCIAFILSNSDTPLSGTYSHLPALTVLYLYCLALWWPLPGSILCCQSWLLGL